MPSHNWVRWSVRSRGKGPVASLLRGGAAGGSGGGAGGGGPESDWDLAAEWRDSGYTPVVPSAAPLPLTGLFVLGDAVRGVLGDPLNVLG